MTGASAPVWAQSTKTLSQWLSGLLLAAGFAGFTIVPGVYDAYRIRGDYRNGSIAAHDAIELIVQSTSHVMSTIASLLSLPILILMIVWTHTGYRNLKFLEISDPPRTTGWAIGGWFIPVVNVFLAKHIINKIWRATGPKALESNKNKRGSERFFTVGWILFFVAFSLSIYTLRNDGVTVTSLGYEGPTDFQTLRIPESTYLIRVIASVLFPVSQVFAAVGIRNISKRYDEKRHVIAATQDFRLWTKD